MEGICEVAIQDGEERVVFNDDFNQKLTLDIIQFLSKYQRVKFGQRFNQSVDNLPESLTHLEFGEEFNRLVVNLPIV